MPSADALLTANLLYDHLRLNAFGFDRAESVRQFDDRVGIEVEFFPLIRSQIGTPWAQPEREGNDFFIGLYPWLYSLAERYCWQFERTEAAAALGFLLPGGGRLTLEPGGQVEYSSPTFDSVSEALDDVERVEQLLCREGESAGLTFAAEGYNRRLGPAARPRLVVRKPRYLVMDRHFERIGPFGRQMMRQTCATQINLDFGPADTALRRWRLANLIAPSLNALFANSPRRLHAVPYQSYRYEIWRRADPTRAGKSVGGGNEDPVEAYLRFALDARVMLIPSGEGEDFLWPIPSMTFREWMNGGGDSAYRFPDMEDWERHLTTLFPHVRPRGFLEIRSIDALPPDKRRAAVLLTTELLYNNRLLDAALALCAGETDSEKMSVPTASGILNGGKPGGGDDWKERLALGQKLLALAVEETGNELLRDYEMGNGKLEVRS